MAARAVKHGAHDSVDSDGNSPTGKNSEGRDTCSALWGKVYSDLAESIEPDPVLYILQERGFNQNLLRDLRMERFSSGKNTKLIEAVQKGGYEAYSKFKSSLAQCGQQPICTFLERAEKCENTADLQRELREKAREQMKRFSEDNTLCNEFKEDLVGFYKKNESVIPASPLVEDHAVPLMELYVQPPMSAFVEPNAFGQGNKRPLKTPVSSYRMLFLNGDNVPYTNIYVEANAGCWKTDFTQMVAMPWCQPDMQNTKTVSKFVDVDTIQRFDLLFLLHLRDFQDKKVCLLEELILKFVEQSLPEP